MGGEELSDCIIDELSAIVGLNSFDLRMKLSGNKSTKVMM